MISDTVGVPSIHGGEDVKNGLTAEAVVKVYGVPQSIGTLEAYVRAYYTGTAPTN